MVPLLLLLLAICADAQSLSPQPSAVGRAVDKLDPTYSVSSWSNATHYDVAITVTTDGWAAFGIR